MVLSYALDRLSRKQTHVAILVEEMEERGVHLDFVTEKFEDTATGQLLRSVKAFAAEFEREKIAERTMRGKAERARSGRLPQATGRGMFGYIYDPGSGKRRINPDQGSVVCRLFEDFAYGASIVGLTNALNDECIPTMHGKAWTAATIFHMLRNSWLCRSNRVSASKGRQDPRRGDWQEEAPVVSAARGRVDRRARRDAGNRARGALRCGPKEA